MNREAQVILNHIEVGGGFHGIYVLGCFAKHLTIYSQQVRALNLIKALLENNKVQPNDEIVIIGAGIAGTTCAVAAVKMGLKVKLFENKYERPMGLQVISKHRYVHPHIYEWPNPESYNPDAGLPFMNWQANTASNVVIQLKEYWDDFYDKHREFVEFIAIEGDPIIDDKTDDEGYRSVDYKVRNGKNETYRFKAVILAVGFGVEEEEQYWSTGDYSHVVSGNKVLISGNGDGALTDLMAVLFESFDHQAFLEFIKSDDEAIALGKKILDLEVNGKNEAKIVEIFQNARLANFEKLFTLTSSDKSDSTNPIVSRKNIHVDINGTLKSLYGSKSSILNRLIFSQLNRHLTMFQKRYDIVATQAANGMYNVTMTFNKGDKKDHYNLVIKRHGPRPPLVSSSFAYGEIYNASNHLIKLFQKYSYNDDPTLKKIYKIADFENEPDFNESGNDFIALEDPLTSFWTLPTVFEERAYILSNPQKPIKISPNDYYRISDFVDRDSIVEALTFLARVNRNNKILKVPYTCFSSKEPQSDLILLGGPISAYGSQENQLVKDVNQFYIKDFRFEITLDNEYALFLGDRRFETIRKVAKNKSKTTTEDWGVIYRCPNPWNNEARIISFQGVESQGTLGAIYAMSYPKVAMKNANLINKKVKDPNDPLFYAIVRINVIDNVVEPPILDEDLIFPL